MSELSGMELRKALCNALGWSAHVDGEFGYTPQRYSTYERLPHYESDPAAFWPAFEAWCESQQRVHSYFCRWERGYRPIMTITIDHKPQPEGPADATVIHGEGLTRLEANCRAWLTAIQSLKER